MGDFVELKQYASIVLRRWWLVLLALAAALLLGFGYLQMQPRLYEATTSVLVGQSLRAVNVTNSDFRTSEELAQTYAALARREPVLSGAVETLGLDMRWQNLRGRVDARLVPGTQLLEISVRANNAQDAVDIANEIADQLILLSPTALLDEELDETQAFVNQRLDSLQLKIEDGQARLETLEAVDVSTLTAAEITQLQNDINAIEELIATWELNYAQLLNFADNQRSSNYLAIVESAQPRPRPVSPNGQLIMGVAAVLGLAAGLGLAFLLETLDDTVRSVDDLARVTNLNPLGAIRDIKDTGQGLLITHQGKFTPDSEAFRMVRSNIQFVSADKPGKSIMVSSAVHGEGRSMAAANLSVVMAQSGLRTILVDADLRRPAQQKIFGLPDHNGLAELLRQPNLETADFLTDTDIPELRVLTSGDLPPNPSELLGSQRMAAIMAALADLADVIIYDSPPAVLMADAPILAKQVDGVVLLVEAGETKRDVVRQAIYNLRQAGANLYGIVMNRVTSRFYNYA